MCPHALACGSVSLPLQRKLPATFWWCKPKGKEVALSLFSQSGGHQLPSTCLAGHPEGEVTGAQAAVSITCHALSVPQPAPLSVISLLPTHPPAPGASFCSWTSRHTTLQLDMIQLITSFQTSCPKGREEKQGPGAATWKTTSAHWVSNPFCYCSLITNKDRFFFFYKQMLT